MGANESSPSVEKRALPKMVDLEMELQKWAWKMYQVTTAEGPKLSHNDVNLEVIWDNVHFETNTMSYANEIGPSAADTNMIFQSDYENNTKELQEHNFSTQRTTDAISTTVLAKGFIRGVKTGICIPVPPAVCKVTSSFGNEVVVSTEEQNSVKHSITWTANSNIRVPPYKRTVARLEIQQQTFQCDFVGTVTFRGRVKVVITNNKTRTFVRVIENNISQIVNDILDNGNIVYNSMQGDGVVIRERSVHWPIVGELRFRYGVSQKVVVSHA